MSDEIDKLVAKFVDTTQYQTEDGEEFTDTDVEDEEDDE